MGADGGDLRVMARHCGILQRIDRGSKGLCSSGWGEGSLRSGLLLCGRSWCSGKETWRAVAVQISK